MNEKNIFDIILLIARPAAGKSEVIDFLKQIPLEERIQRFHIGECEPTVHPGGSSASASWRLI
jgi:hypothetical protein